MVRLNPYNFAPASPEEEIVFGACRPAHSLTPKDSGVEEWITFTQAHEIRRVCCLLNGRLNLYDDLLGSYSEAFGHEKTLLARVSDFSVIDSVTFCEEILPFLDQADGASERVVVHCSAGSGRTGHVLALWLASRRGYSLDRAIASLRETGRNPLEAASKQRLMEILAKLD